MVNIFGECKVDFWFLGQALCRLLSGHWLQLKDKHSNESEPMLNHYLFWKQSHAKRKTLGEIIENKQNSLATRDFSSSASSPGSFFPVMHFGSATVQSADASPNFTLLRGRRMHLNHNNPLLEALCVSSFPWTQDQTPYESQTSTLSPTTKISFLDQLIQRLLILIVHKKTKCRKIGGSANSGHGTSSFFNSPQQWLPIVSHNWLRNKTFKNKNHFHTHTPCHAHISSQFTFVDFSITQSMGHSIIALMY